MKDKKLTIQPGCMYYDLDHAPIGARTGRAPEQGLTAHHIESIPVWHGCNCVGYTKTGKKVAFHTEFTREHYHDK